ncbi:hypothetical protein RvY_14390 [Ramazzottius varieornatus]|uniref:Uncharacterized protein n=1 Tax=Ramazzottius varieornatus TaxID=947166 RepID=A0A1D1VSV1_RAMVA|nr:hypothetical protein RvY_14390 [Ramazzottius varieornatus]
MPLSGLFLDAGVPTFITTQTSEFDDKNYSKTAGTSVAHLVLPDDVWMIWFIDAAQIYKATLTEQQLENKSKGGKTTVVNFIKAVKYAARPIFSSVFIFLGLVSYRESFDAGKTRVQRRDNGRVELSIKEFYTLTYLFLLEPVKTDAADIRFLLLQFGSNLNQCKKENKDLTDRIDDLERQALAHAVPGGVGNATQSMPVFSENRTRKVKKPKIDPHMSVINPASRKVKPPKGVEFDDNDDDDEED